MGTAIRITTVVALCCLCNMGSHAEQTGETRGSESGKVMGVTIELTKLEITDSSLGVSYRIRNSLDHDVWVCTRVSSTPHEVFLAYDTQTLVIRRRLDVPSTWVWRRPPAPGTYMRLSPGTAQPESLQLELPVIQQLVYAGGGSTEAPQTARRLALEIGYYDEDLPALVRSILDVAGKFAGESWKLDPNMERTYFRGLGVRGALSAYGVMNKDPYGEGRVYIDYSHQALTGEKVLRIEVTGLSIPYKGVN